MFEHDAAQVLPLVHVSVEHTSASSQSALMLQTGFVHEPPQQMVPPVVHAVSFGTALLLHDAVQVPPLLHVSAVHSFASSIATGPSMSCLSACWPNSRGPACLR